MDVSASLVVVPQAEPPFLADSSRDPARSRQRLASCARRWRLGNVAPLSGGFRSEVFHCTSAAGEEVVVKLAPHTFEAATEAAALTAWAGTGAAVTLVDFDLEHAALLLDRIRPGSALSASPEVDAVDVASELLGRLHVEPSPRAGFPGLPDIYDVMERWCVEDNAESRKARSRPELGATALAYLPAARRLAMALCRSAPRTVLLHGDFCDKNLLSNGAGYVSIDPIVRVGDRCADIGFFAAGRPPVADILGLAEAVAARLGEDPLRAQRWAAVWTVHQAAQGWRSDQEELEAFVGGRDARRLLAP